MAASSKPTGAGRRTDTLHMSRATAAAYYAAQHRQNRECRSARASRGGARPVSGLRGVLRLPCAGNHRRHFETFYFAYLVAVDEGDYDRAAALATVHAPARVARLCPGGASTVRDLKARGDEAARFEWLVRAAMADVQGPSATTAPWAAWLIAAPGDAARAMRCIRVAINDTRKLPLIRPSVRGATWRFCPRSSRRVQRAQCVRLRARCTSRRSSGFFSPLSAIGGVLFTVLRTGGSTPCSRPCASRTGNWPSWLPACARNQCRPEPAEHPHADANRIKGGLYIGGFLKTISEYIYKLADTCRHVG